MANNYSLKENLEYLELQERIMELKKNKKGENLKKFSKINTIFAIVSFSFSGFVYYVSKSIENAFIVFAICCFLLSIFDTLSVFKLTNKKTKKDTLNFYQKKSMEIKQKSDFLFELNILLDNKDNLEKINNIIEKENYYNLRKLIKTENQ